MTTKIKEPSQQNRWIFTRDNIARSPSRLKGISESLEAQYRYKTCSFIERAASELGYPVTVSATACVLLNRFYTRQSYTEHDRMITAQTCLFLAGKIEETSKKVQDVIIVSYKIIRKTNIKQDTHEFFEIRDKLLCMERIIMYTLSFALDVEHPYNELIHTLTASLNFETTRILDNVKQASWLFLNDSFKTNVCLLYSPSTVACACILLGTKYCNVSLRFSDGDRPSKKEAKLCKIMNVNEGDLENAIDLLLELYEYSNVKVTKNNTAAISSTER